MTLSYFTTPRFASTGVCVCKLFFRSRRNATSAIARRRQLGHKSRPSRCSFSLLCCFSSCFFTAPAIQVAQKFLNPSLAETAGNLVVLFLGSWHYLSLSCYVSVSFSFAYAFLREKESLCLFVESPIEHGESVRQPNDDYEI